jgi:(E)-4-hydroxy-3-methylbut-2-enyl-diphosphate synthase
MEPTHYCHNPYHYQRRLSREVKVGRIGIGGANPIRVQSMLTCDTMDTRECVKQTLDLVKVGCELVRITAPTVKDAANLKNIKAELIAAGCDVPIVADIHFKPDAAMEAAQWVEKVRVNPGNFADKKKFAIREYTDEQYVEELDRIDETFKPLVQLCQQRGIAMRIGTNHGSLSDRIMNRFGDTPAGMVESAVEFARIARKYGYHDFVFSMKSSNPKVMINAYRLLAARLLELGPDWNYPLHLGVTEAGDGEDGRIKSAIGIGALLADGLGDTIRVSLTEDSVHEIPVATALVALSGLHAKDELPPQQPPLSFHPRGRDPEHVPGHRAQTRAARRSFSRLRRRARIDHRGRSRRRPRAGFSCAIARRACRHDQGRLHALAHRGLSLSRRANSCQAPDPAQGHLHAACGRCRA